MARGHFSRLDKEVNRLLRGGVDILTAPNIDEDVKNYWKWVLQKDKTKHKIANPNRTKVDRKAILLKPFNAEKTGSSSNVLFAVVGTTRSLDFGKAHFTLATLGLAVTAGSGMVSSAHPVGYIPAKIHLKKILDTKTKRTSRITGNEYTTNTGANTETWSVPFGLTTDSGATYATRAAALETIAKSLTSPKVSVSFTEEQIKIITDIYPNT
jgi:hypothetical protein